MKMTYLGIGSCPHTTDITTFTPKEDQLLPQCFHELLLREKMPMRILHFDPWFDRCQEFLHQYFARWNLIPIDMDGGYRWIGDQIEVIILPSMIDHKEHFWFFEGLCETILQKKGKLVIQEFTGYSLKELNQTLLDSAPNKELFKRRVLMDMTFGTDVGCCTDMTKAQPYYDYDGNFLNLHFVTDIEAVRWIGISIKVDEILRKLFVTKYLQLLNNIHVDYRRKLKGESLMFGNPLYTEESTPDEIMRVLQEALRPCFEILLKLRCVDKERQDKLNTLFLTYKSHDPYKWHELLHKLIPLP